MKVRGPATLGFFHGLVDLVPSLDKVFEEHPRTATVFEGTSKTVQNELLDCMASVIRERIVEELLHQIMPYVDMMYQKLQKRYTDMVFIIIPAELHQQCSGHQGPKLLSTAAARSTRYHKVKEKKRSRGCQKRYLYSLMTNDNKLVSQKTTMQKNCDHHFPVQDHDKMYMTFQGTSNNYCLCPLTPFYLTSSYFSVVVNKTVKRYTENRCSVASGQLLKTAKNLWKSMPTELKLYVYKYTVHVCKNVKEMLSKEIGVKKTEINCSALHEAL
ncbi:hypothetical protein D9C73_020449 [Collichthys lucidus]|uniref:Uncharacterized protein n=1 Tax=Collichthys lucidus TaxID=240159 RepID=A0A4V6ARZ4_COLLU|nr:hypothetical protein D9C73_020449 [Collichthys lucidus]